MILDAIWSHLLLLYITGKVGQFVLFGMWLLCILHRVATYISWCGVLWMQLIPKEADCYYACELQRTTVKPSRRHFFLTKVRPATQKLLSGFVQTLESPGIKMLRFPGLESPGKRHRSWKTLEKSWNSKVLVLEILISGTSITNLRRNSL